MICAKKFENSKLMYFLIAAACSNFFGRGSVLLLVACIFMLFKIGIKNINLNGEAGILALLSASMIPVGVYFYTYDEVIKAVIYFCVYVCGYCGYQIASDKKRFVTRTIFSIFMGFALNVVLTFFYNLDKGTAGTRILYSVWTGELISVTLLGLMTSVIIGYSFYALFCSKSVANKLISATVLFFALLVNINSATRTPILMFVIVYTFMTFLFLCDRRGVKGLRIFLVILFVILFLAVIYATDTFGIKSFILDSPLFARMQNEGLETGRFAIMVYYLKEMPHHLWGGGYVKESVGRLAHTYLQEFYDLYGVIGFVLLIIVSYYIVKHMVSLIVLKKKTSVDFLFISMYLAMFLQLFLEPVFTGYPILFWSLLLINGMATVYLKNRKAEKKV